MSAIASTAALGRAPRPLSRYTRELSVAAAYLVLLAILAIVRPDFFRVQFRLTWISSAHVLVAAVGMTLVIIARQIDISIGSTFSICGVCAALLAKAGLPMPAVILATLAIGAFIGATNGLLVAVLGLPSIVVTLATMVILQQSLTWIRQGLSVQNLPENFQWFGFSQTTGQVLLLTTSLCVFAIFLFAMRQLSAARAIYAVGSDQEAARLAGIRPKLVVFVVFTLMGALTPLAAIMDSVRFSQIDTNSGTGLELQIIAAVVVGGAAISGGRGNLLGTLAGVALLSLIGSALVFLHVDPAWQDAVQGAVILIAVSSEALTRRTT